MRLGEEEGRRRTSCANSVVEHWQGCSQNLCSDLSSLVCLHRTAGFATMKAKNILMFELKANVEETRLPAAP